MKGELRGGEDLNIVLDPASALSLQHQLRQKMIDAIHRGVLRPGRRLPSSRKLADRIGVSRNTVTLAYDALLAEGHLISRLRSGIFVSPDMPSGRIAAGPRSIGLPSRLTARLTPAPDEGGFRCPSNWHQFPFPFVDGCVNSELLPLPEWREAMRLAYSRNDALGWNVAGGDVDDLVLLEEMRSKVLPVRGLNVGPDELLMMPSSRAGLQLVGELLVRRGAAVVLEEPFDPEFHRRIKERQADISMLDPTLLEPLPQGAIVVTSVRRSHDATSAHPRALLAAVAAADGVLVEHDMPPGTRDASHAAPSLRALDDEGRVVHLGSLAPVVSCGEPPGFVVADATFIDRLRQLRRSQGTAPSAVSQRTWAYFIGLGHYSATLARAGRVLQARRLALRDALNHYLHKYCRIETMPGASAYWVSVSDEVDAKDLAQRAAASGILLEPVRIAEGREAFCMGVTGLLEGQIREGIRVLSGLIRSQLAPRGRHATNSQAMPLQGQALRKTVAGATLLYNTVYGDPCTLSILRDGELVGIAGYANEDCDRGRWWIEGDRWFRQWQQWAYGEVSSYAMAIDGDQLRLYGSDGLLADTAIIIRRPRTGTRKQSSSVS